MRGATMTKIRLGAFLLAIAVILGPGMAHATLWKGWTPEDDDIFLVLHGEVLPLDAKGGGPEPLPNRSPDSIVSNNGLTFRIFYLDSPGSGFFDNQLGALRQLRYEDALLYLTEILNENGTLDVIVRPSLNNQQSFTLASAGTLFSGAGQFQNGSAFDRIMTGSKPFAGFAEVEMEVNFGADYHITSDIPGNNVLGLQSVLLHETLHALGFITLTDATGSNTVFTGFDSFLARSNGGQVMFELNNQNQPEFVGSATDLISNDLVFNGPQATAQFGSNPPIFCPNPFQPGSSISHWRKGSIPGGAVMEESFQGGEVDRQLPRFEAAALIDLGWNQINLNQLTTSPSADFTVSDTTVGVGDSIDFTDLSLSGSSPVNTVLWEFGDGTTSNQLNPSKSYSEVGDFTVKLTVTTGVSSDSETKTNLISVEGDTVADFSADITAGVAPLTVQFTDESETDGQTINSYSWVFGDGGTSTVANPQHTYTNEGTFTVRLTITTSGGSDVETKTAFISVMAVPDGCGACNQAKTSEGPEGDVAIAAAALGLLVIGRLRRRR